MSSKNIAIGCAILFSLFVFSAFQSQQSCNPITRPQLRELISQLGYEIKNINTTTGTESYQITTTRNGIDVPVLLSISASNGYIWLTVLLGPAKKDNPGKILSLMEENKKVQPCSFYINDLDQLMIGLAVDNRGVNNTILRSRIDFISTHVGDSKGLWQ